jgi:hypothetical protein
VTIAVKTGQGYIHMFKDFEKMRTVHWRCRIIIAGAHGISTRIPGIVKCRRRSDHPTETQ